MVLTEIKIVKLFKKIDLLILLFNTLIYFLKACQKASLIFQNFIFLNWVFYVFDFICIEIDIFGDFFYLLYKFGNVCNFINTFYISFNTLVSIFDGFIEIFKIIIQDDFNFIDFFVNVLLQILK